MAPWKFNKAFKIFTGSVPTPTELKQEPVVTDVVHLCYKLPPPKNKLNCCVLILLPIEMICQLDN